VRYSSSFEGKYQYRAGVDRPMRAAIVFMLVDR
jgi:hypothetical protein